LLDMLFPTYCAGCGAAGGRVLCDRCLAEALGGGLRLIEGTDCAGASFRGYRAAGAYRGLLREMILRLKSSVFPFAVPLSALMVAAAGNDPSYLLPERIYFVPSERAKERERGFNPAEALASLVSSHIGRPISRGLVKVRHTADQDSLDRESRLENVKGAFAFRPEEGLAPPARVMLVDDVLTTGATADACAAVLLEAGAESVNLLLAARVANS